MGIITRLEILVGFILFGFAKSQTVSPPDSSFWPNATAYYSVDRSFDSTDRSNLQAAIRDYHSKTCIRWVPRSSQSAYVNFQRTTDPETCGAADNCFTAGGVKNARFGPDPGCRKSDVLIHEMGHTLCFGHEQDRNDRDKYVRQDTGSSCPGKYEHLNGGHLYDYKSVMHYGCGSPCITPTRSGISSCGSEGGGLSILDAEKLNGMYKCGGCFGYRFKFPDQIKLSQDSPVVAGTDGGRDMYPCRAYVEGDIVPGKAVLSPSPICWVSYGGSEYRLDSEFEILTNPKRVANLRWTPEGRVTSIPKNAIGGGRTDSGESLYIARCQRDIGGGQKILIPGKIHKNSPQNMFYGYGGEEHECTNYQLLVCG